MVGDERMPKVRGAALRKHGRPPIYGKSMKQRTLAMPADRWEAADKLAMQDGVSTNAELRRLIDAGFEARGVRLTG